VLQNLGGGYQFEDKGIGLGLGSGSGVGVGFRVGSTSRATSVRCLV